MLHHGNQLDSAGSQPARWPLASLSPASRRGAQIAVDTRHLLIQWGRRESRNDDNCKNYNNHRRHLAGLHNTFEVLMNCSLGSLQLNCCFNWAAVGVLLACNRAGRLEEREREIHHYGQSALSAAGRKGGHLREGRVASANLGPTVRTISTQTTLNNMSNLIDLLAKRIKGGRLTSSASTASGRITHEPHNLSCLIAIDNHQPGAQMQP